MSAKKCSECPDKAIYRIVAVGGRAYRLCRNLCQSHFDKLVSNGMYDGQMRVTSCKEIVTKCRRPLFE